MQETNGYYRPLTESAIWPILNCANANDLGRPSRSFQLFFSKKISEHELLATGKFLV